MRHWGTFILGIAAVLVLFLFAIFFFLLGPAAENSQGLSVQILPGNGLGDIARLLADQGLIKSRAAFSVYSFFSGSAHKLKPGSYIIAGNAGARDIVREIERGPRDTEVQIIEGRSLRDIDNQLSALGLIREGELIEFPADTLAPEFPFLEDVLSLEGFLFPDTYRIAPNASVSDIVERLLKNFERKALSELGFAQGNEEWYDALIAASLIEREVPFPEDRGIVSGILWKRLTLGIPLHVDATVLYLSCGGRTIGCQPLTKPDFQVQSPYNTYVRRGFPPSPIANPGLNAIHAALNPAPTAYLFYLSDPKTRKTVFSTTLEEHNMNRARYLR